MNINLNSFANLIPGGEQFSEIPQTISNAIQSLEGGSSHSERCEEFFGAVSDRIQQLQQGGTLTAQDVAGFRQAIAYGDSQPMPGIDLNKLDLKVGTNPFLRRCGGDDDGRVRDHRDGDDGYRCGGNDHDADDRGIDWIHPRRDPDPLQDDRERLGKDEKRLNRDYDRCEDDVERIGDDLEDGNWKALGSDMQRYAQDVQHYGRDIQRYDRDVQRYERDLSSEPRIRPLNEDFLQDTAEIQARTKLR